MVLRERFVALFAGEHLWTCAGGRQNKLYPVRRSSQSLIQRQGHVDLGWTGPVVLLIKYVAADHPAVLHLACDVVQGFQSAKATSSRV